MLQLRDHAGFIVKFRKFLFIPKPVPTWDLERDQSVEFLVAGQKDISKPAAAKTLQNLIPTDALERWHCVRGNGAVRVLREINRLGGREVLSGRTVRLFVYHRC
jgi:hypothetical protein